MPSDDAAASGPQSEGAPEAAAQGPAALEPSQAALHLPLMDFICANFAQLTSESGQLLPSDIAKATSANA